jgi:molybdate-binding protein
MLFHRLIGVANRGYPNRSFPGPGELFTQQLRGVQLDIDKLAPGFRMARISSHEQAGVAVAAGMAAAGIGIQAIIKNFGAIEDAFGLDLGNF